MSDVNIRLECLRPAERWVQPTGAEIREVLHLAGLTGGQAARTLGLGAKGDRTVRR
ncbi:transcriptional repressor KorC, partial [Salmonella enterica subsp. enterica]|nr:transcriptional repressor KorC [Salmonella enterica subsp. enterica]